MSEAAWQQGQRSYLRLEEKACVTWKILIQYIRFFGEPPILYSWKLWLSETGINGKAWLYHLENPLEELQEEIHGGIDVVEKKMTSPALRKTEQLSRNQG